MNLDILYAEKFPEKKEKERERKRSKNVIIIKNAKI